MAFQPTQAVHETDEIILPVKSTKTFKEYYADPEYRKKHLSHMKERVKCPECGFTVSRSNMAKHKRTKRHNQVILNVKDIMSRTSTESMKELLQSILENTLKRA